MATNETKDFHLSDVLTITTGRLVSSRHIEGVYDILNWMTGESLMTHQLPRVSREATPLILFWHPALANVVVDEARMNPEGIASWVADQITVHGEYLPIPKFNPNEHERIDPMSELSEMVHPSRIVVVAPPTTTE